MIRQYRTSTPAVVGGTLGWLGGAEASTRSTGVLRLDSVYWSGHSGELVLSGYSLLRVILHGKTLEITEYDG